MELWLLMLVLMLTTVALLLLVAGRARSEEQLRARRWARVAQRRAPVRRRGGGYDHLLDHIERQIDLLLSERHRLYLLITKGQRLRGMMQASVGMRPRIPTVDQAIRHLQGKAEQLDVLIGRYYQHRDDLCILREAEEFNRELEEMADSPVGDPFGLFQTATDELDEETERLMAIAEAEDELNLLLRS